MTETLLRTKLYVPPLRPNLLPRPRLIERLNRCLQPGLKLTIVSAPVGYGKTTALIQWARSINSPVGWLSLDRSDNDLHHFFRYLVMAWSEAQPEILESALGTLIRSMSPDKDWVLTAFINLANEIPDHTALVLNDYHLIEEPAIHEALAFLLDHLPPKLHIILASRGEPALSLARYRARGEMLEIGTDDLSFRPQEVQDLLNERMGLARPSEEIKSLQARLEGWIAGIQLAALGLRRAFSDADQLAVTGRQRFVVDYLREEVLAYLADDKRQFLLQTSILERLCGPLCEAVTAMEGGQVMLETLEREALFLMPLDDQRAWFRYHGLFAELLQEELQRSHPDEIRGLHQRAAHWYMAQDLPEPAFNHAIAAHDGDIMVQLADRYFEMMLHVRELKLLKSWLDTVPAEWHFEYPVIGLVHAGWLAFTGSLDACMRRVDAIEHHLAQADREDKRWQLARVNTVRCQIACIQGDLAAAEPYARRALKALPKTDHHYRANIHQSLGDTYRNAGRWAEAQEQYHKALELTDDPEFRIRSVHVFGALADLKQQQGQVRRAAGYWDKALTVIKARDTWGRFPLPLIGWAYIRMGEILYEWNELAEAWDHLLHGLERSELGGDVRAMATGYLTAGRIKLAEGNVDAAAEYLVRTRPLLERAQFAHLNGRFDRFQVELWLAQDRLRAVVNWSDEMLKEDALGERSASEISQLAIARVLIVKGDEPALGQAIAMVEKRGQRAEAEGRKSIFVEALVLQALAYKRRGFNGKALAALGQALRLAEPEGYVRLFTDLGLPMARLLQEARSREVLPDYVSTLLTAFGGDVSRIPSTVRPLPEPLTKRETEILALLAAGLTNQQIAEELVVSPLTVKKHASNIYSKLSVGGRAEAGARARELGLLD